MVILIIILFCLCIWKIRFASYHEDYISPAATNAVKGIFAVLILYSHMKGYLSLGGGYSNYAFQLVMQWFGQLMVAMYFFYSGYGIMESVKRKVGYSNSFFKNRILKTLVHFDIAVLLYLILQAFLGQKYQLGYIAAGLIGWESVGNSNWFIFVILALYAISWPSMMVCRRNRTALCVMVTAMSALLWLALYRNRPEMDWWYDTLMVFPLGMWYSCFKEQIEKALSVNTCYYVAVCLMAVLFLGLKWLMGIDIYGVSACLFCLLLVMLSMKIKFDNPALQWLGAQAFAIYIMQRWPMALLEHSGINSSPALFVAISIPSVLIVAWGFTKLLRSVDSFLFRK